MKSLDYKKCVFFKISIKRNTVFEPRKLNKQTSPTGHNGGLGSCVSGNDGSIN